MDTYLTFFSSCDDPDEPVVDSSQDQTSMAGVIEVCNSDLHEGLGGQQKKKLLRLEGLRLVVIGVICAGEALGDQELSENFNQEVIYTAYATVRAYRGIRNTNADHAERIYVVRDSSAVLNKERDVMRARFLEFICQPLTPASCFTGLLYTAGCRH